MVLIETFSGIIGRVVEDGDLHHKILSLYRLSGYGSRIHFPYRITEELYRVAHADGAPCRVVVLPHDTHYGVERVALPFILRDVAENRLPDYDTSHLKILKRLFVDFLWKKRELVFQLWAGHQVCKLLLWRIEIAGSLDGSLYLPDRLVPCGMCLDREIENRAVADENGVQQIRVVALQHFVQMPAAFRIAHGLTVPFRRVNGILLIVVQQEK